MSPFSFRKNEILRKKKLIDRLFAEGASFYIFPFKILWLTLSLESQYPAQVLISVGKRSFKNATDRNRVKRQIRELYRLHKHEFYEYLATSRQNCVLGIIYTTNAHLPTEDLDFKIKAVLRRLFSELNKKLNNSTISLSE